MNRSESPPTSLLPAWADRLPASADRPVRGLFYKVPSNTVTEKNPFGSRKKKAVPEKKKRKSPEKIKIYCNNLINNN
jgi:hypothetical protein